MTHKEKAEELFKKMLSKNPSRQDGISAIDTIQAKLCALVAVDDIIKSIVPKDDDERLVYELCGNQFYWKEVKQELEKL